MVGVIWGQTRYLGTGGANRGTDTTFGPGGRTFDPLDLSKRLSGGEATPGHPDFGTGTMFGMPIRNVQCATFNSQLSMG